MCLFSDWESAASKALSKENFDYVQEAAGDELTSKDNRSDLDRCKIIPRILRGIAGVDTSTSVLGMNLPSPIMLAPVGGQELFDAGGELSVAKASSRLGIPMVVSTVSSYSLESISSQLGNTDGIFQLYMFNDDEFNRSLVERAENSGYKSIIFTVDGPTIGRRPRSIKNGFSNEGHTSGNMFGKNNEKALGKQLKLKCDISWSDVDKLREWTSLPVVLKGIVSPLDATEAMDRGVDGIVVSNHGGRQLDGAISSISALGTINRATKGEITILLDGGIRSGSDILKALCLGADAVLIGRLYVYALSVAGSKGVEKALVDLLSDLQISMLNSGISSVKEADPSYITGPA
ncbi:hypothetical protein IX51_05305 [uncultured archaeon]|nr:hypothetical protein IX51_05305 [uncultured archaeon]